MKAILGLVASVVLAGCSSEPLGPDPGAEGVVSSVQEEVALNAEASSAMRLITRLYVGDYAALEWYQPVAGVIAFSVVQPGGLEPIDNESLRGLSPTQVFKLFARSLEVPDALAKLEAHPEVLQELQDKDAIERFSPEPDVKYPGVLPQSAFATSQGNSPFTCTFSNFRRALCLDAAWPKVDCLRDQTGTVTKTHSDVDESQTAVCSILGTTQMRIDISGCQTFGGDPEGGNRCSGTTVAGAGTFLDVSGGFLRSWHGRAQTYFGFDDAYKHVATARPKAGSFPIYEFVTRSFWDLR